MVDEHSSRPSLARLLVLAIGGFILTAGPVYLYAFLTGFNWAVLQ
jgi:hypothetical protein